MFFLFAHEGEAKMLSSRCWARQTLTRRSNLQSIQCCSPMGCAPSVYQHTILCTVSAQREIHV